MRFMTGSRFSRVKHSTGADLENRKPRNGVRRMRHATGQEFDMTTEDPELAVTTTEEELARKREESRQRLQEAVVQDTERELVEVGVDHQSE